MGDSVIAVAAYEPVVPGSGETDMPRLGTALERTTFFERWAGAVPALLNDLGQDNAYEGPRSIDPEALEEVSVPVLVLRGEQTLLTSLWGESAEHVARHVRDTHIRELPGVGHFAPVLAPEVLAE